MLKKVAVVLIVTLSITGIFAYADNSSFKDVKEKDWYYENLMFLAKKDIVQGNDKGYFMPNETVKYNQYLKMVVVALTGETMETNSGEKWDKPYIDKAYDLNLIPDKAADYNIPINRYEMAEIALKGLTVLKEEDVQDFKKYENTIKDYKDVPTDYSEIVLKTFSKGIITGYADGTFGGEKSIRRSESVAVVARLLDKNQRVLPKDIIMEKVNENNIVENILDNAGKRDIFAIVSNPNSKTYQALLEEESIQIDTPEDSFGLADERVFIIPISEEVTIKLENVDYNSTLNYFYRPEIVVEKEGKKGEVLYFDTYLPEGIPQMRVIVVPQYEIRLGAWYCQYDGEGTGDVVYISDTSAFQPIKNNSNIESLSVAATVTAILSKQTSEISEYITPEKILWKPEIYWDTIVEALTLIADKESGMFEWTSVEFPCQAVHKCGEALFPELSHPILEEEFFIWPDENHTSGINYGFENCIMYPADYGNIVAWKVLESKDNSDNKSGYVVVEAYSKYHLEKPVIYKVNWEADIYQDMMSPFQYHLVGLTKLEAYP